MPPLEDGVIEWPILYNAPCPTFKLSDSLLHTTSSSFAFDVMLERPNKILNQDIHHPKRAKATVIMKHPHQRTGPTLTESLHRGGVLASHPLFSCVQHHCNFVGDHCLFKHWKHGW